MTVHASKGLEFPYVYISGMEENLFPSSMSGGSMETVEEERRLFYVALTRAEKAVTLSYAGSRFLNGKTSACRPSRFLKEIDPQYLAGIVEDSSPEDSYADDDDFPYARRDWSGYRREDRQTTVRAATTPDMSRLKR